jgi:hypothetical protein
MKFKDLLKKYPDAATEGAEVNIVYTNSTLEEEVDHYQGPSFFAKPTAEVDMQSLENAKIEWHEQVFNEDREREPLWRGVLTITFPKKSFPTSLPEATMVINALLDQREKRERLKENYVALIKQLFRFNTYLDCSMNDLICLDKVLDDSRHLCIYNPNLMLKTYFTIIGYYSGYAFVDSYYETLSRLVYTKVCDKDVVRGYYSPEQKKELFEYFEDLVRDESEEEDAQNIWDSQKIWDRTLNVFAEVGVEQEEIGESYLLFADAKKAYDKLKKNNYHCALVQVVVNLKGKKKFYLIEKQNFANIKNIEKQEER